MDDETWALLGEVDGDEALVILTRLHALYQADEKGENGREIFFVRLEQVIDQVRQCNLNRR